MRGVTGAEAAPPAGGGGGEAGGCSSAVTTLAARAGGAASARREVQGCSVSERPGDSMARCCGDGGCQAASLGPPPGRRLGYSWSKAAWHSGTLNHCGKEGMWYFQLLHSYAYHHALPNPAGKQSQPTCMS